MTQPTVRRKPPHRSGLTLVELLIGLAITGTIGAAIATMLFGAAQGTGEGNDRRATLVRQRTLAARLTAAIRGSRQVLAVDSDAGVLVLWRDDDDGDGNIDLGELRRIDYDELTRTLRSCKASSTAPAAEYDDATDFLAVTEPLAGTASLPGEAWATGVTSWSIALDHADPRQATFVALRVRVETRGGATSDELIASAALRNAQ